MRLSEALYRPLDLVHVHQPKTGKQFHSFLQVSWGIVSDVDFDVSRTPVERTTLLSLTCMCQSEKHRWMGGFRFTFTGIQTILRKKEYKARVSYVAAPQPAQARSVCEDVNCRRCLAGACFATEGVELPEMDPDDMKAPGYDSEGKHAPPPSLHDTGSEEPAPLSPQHHFTGFATEDEPVPSQSLASTDATLPALEQDDTKWTHVKEGDFNFLTVQNVSMAAQDMKGAPFAHLSDGCADLVLSTNMGRTDMLSLFMDMEKGTHADGSNPNILYTKVRKFKIEPISTDTCFDLDGERLGNHTIVGTVRPSIATIAF